MHRADVVAATQAWVGTPYKHAHSLKGVGADCLGLLRGVWRDLFGYEPEEPPTYGPGWFEIGECEFLLEAASRYLVPRSTGVIQTAEVLVFRLHKSSLAKHCAIVVSDASMIHAYSGVGVVEASITDSWLKCVAGRFDFPGLED